MCWSLATPCLKFGPISMDHGWLKLLTLLIKCIFRASCIRWCLFVVATCRVQYEMHVLDILFLAYILDIYCLTLWYCWYLTVCIKWVNMEFADTKLKFQPINFVYSPCQMYHTNSMHSTTMVDLCLCSVVAVSSIGRLLEICPYSWKPLRFSLFGKWVQVRRSTDPGLTS